MWSVSRLRSSGTRSGRSADSASPRASPCASSGCGWEPHRRADPRGRRPRRGQAFAAPLLGGPGPPPLRRVALPGRHGNGGRRRHGGALRPEHLRRAPLDRDDRRPARRHAHGDRVMSEVAHSGLFETASDQEALERAAAAAAPTGVERADLAMVHTLDASLREPMFALLSSLADKKYVLRRRYAEWCTGAPMLESAVAAAAMAQDELGHARSFYPLLRGFPEASETDTREEAGWQQRPTSALTCLDAPFAGWSDFV